MTTRVEGERDTNLDYDLIHSQQALIDELLWAVQKIEGCLSDTTRFALLQDPKLAVDMDYDPAFDSGWTEVLERYFGHLLGGREDIRIAGMRLSPDHSIVQLGLGYPAYDLERMQIPGLMADSEEEAHSTIEGVWIPDRIIDPENDRAFSSRIFLNHQTGLAYVSFITRRNQVVDGKEKLWAATNFPPKILVGFANLLNQESVYRMFLDVTRSQEHRLLNTPPKVSVQI